MIAVMANSILRTGWPLASALGSATPSRVDWPRSAGWALSKPYVESIAWGNLADINNTIPGGGLMNDMFQPKPAFNKLQEMQAENSHARRNEGVTRAGEGRSVREFLGDRVTKTQTRIFTSTLDGVRQRGVVVLDLLLTCLLIYSSIRLYFNRGYVADPQPAEPCTCG